MKYSFRCEHGKHKKDYKNDSDYQEVLCDVMNSMEGINVIESGYDNGKMRIVFEAYNDYSLSVLARAITAKYNTKLDGKYYVYLRTCDVIGENQMGYVYVLESYSDNDYETIYRKDINEIVGGIRYWSKSQFKEHFNGKIKD